MQQRCAAVQAGDAGVSRHACEATALPSPAMASRWGTAATCSGVWLPNAGIDTSPTPSTSTKALQGRRQRWAAAAATSGGECRDRVSKRAARRFNACVHVGVQLALTGAPARQGRRQPSSWRQGRPGASGPYLI